MAIGTMLIIASVVSVLAVFAALPIWGDFQTYPANGSDLRRHA